jgi:phosphoenolpyruvate synthase/pyruvate phosphate dikinase
VNVQIVWLEAAGVEPDEIGVRASALARLRRAGIAVPRAFVLGRSTLATFLEKVKREEGRAIPVKLPADLQGHIAEALRRLGGSFAIRRSPLAAPQNERDDWMTTTQGGGGRPERETYLNVVDAAEVGEAVRRIWGQGLMTSPPPQQVAIVVQRFLVADVCAVVRRDRADRDVLHVASALGIGDLLAAGLVVPDRHTLRRDGRVLACALGRKAQMTVARGDGGVVRVPVPAHAARRLALDDAKIADLAAVWRAADEAADGLLALGMSWSGGRWYVTSASIRHPEEQEALMLG